MSSDDAQNRAPSRAAKKVHPPGRVKIMRAFRALLAEKSFQEMTWADIARRAGVNEALIYKYFQDKRGLLYQVLAETFQHTTEKAMFSVRGIEGALNKLRRIMETHIVWYTEDRVVARILMLEARNHPSYFRTEAYDAVRGLRPVRAGSHPGGCRVG